MSEMLQFVIAHHFHFCKYAGQGVFPILLRLRPKTFCNFSDISRQELQLFRQSRPHEAPKGRMCSPECYKFNAQTLAAQTTSAAQPSPAQASPAKLGKPQQQPGQASAAGPARRAAAKLALQDEAVHLQAVQQRALRNQRNRLVIGLRLPLARSHLRQDAPGPP